jgi:DnaJ-class molecular chaperone
MRKTPDYYSIIQVDPRAEREVIDAAYRRLASKYHPDVDPSPGATERMKLINAAYEVLSDPERRAAYDLGRTTFPSEQERQGPRASSRQERFDWRTSLLATAFTIALGVLLPRFGLRGLVVAAGLFLLVWLLMSWRKS